MVATCLPVLKDRLFDPILLHKVPLLIPKEGLTELHLAFLLSLLLIIRSVDSLVVLTAENGGHWRAQRYCCVLL